MKYKSLCKFDSIYKHVLVSSGAIQVKDVINYILLCPLLPSDSLISKGNMLSCVFFHINTISWNFSLCGML